jgi:amino acid transporter
MTSTNHRGPATHATPRAGGPKLKRDIGALGLLFASIGWIIGSGWLFGAFNASRIAGPAAIFSWLIGGVLIMLLALTYAELGPMFPISGGVIRYPHLVWGQFTSYSLGFVTWVATVTVPAIETEGALTYATRFFPFTEAAKAGGEVQHVLTPLGYLTAVILLAVFVALNYFGVKLFAQVNNVLVWWKLGIILLVIAVFIITALGTTTMGSPANFTSHGFAPGGVPGVFIAISTAGIVFSFVGFRQGIELAGESRNPRRNIPIAVIGSVGITALIYALLQIAFTLGVPEKLLGPGGWEKLSFTNDAGPLAAIATIAGIGWLAFVLYIDAVVSPADTGLITTAVSSRVSYALAKNGNAPAFLARTNRHGVPWVGLVVTFVAGLIVLLPFPSWQQLVGFITSATVISFGVGPLAVGALRRAEPERERPFRLPGKDVIPLLGFYASNMIVYWAGWQTNQKLFATILIGYVVLAILQLVRRARRRPDRLDFRVGAVWLLPWLGAMALISWLCDPEAHPELFGWVFLINAVVTVVVYALAMRFRLAKERTDANIEDAVDEASEEQPTAAASSPSVV